ncbi:MAG TPA: hypothetical protein VLL25_02915 [Acidimicrobiales bacterium]|nr:hypothetical protein [Acidimicrobiales bacterium]
MEAGQSILAQAGTGHALSLLTSVSTHEFDQYDRLTAQNSSGRASKGAAVAGSRVAPDPLEPQPHDPDVRALLRIAVLWNIPIACNRATADYLISSPLLDSDYRPLQPDYGDSQSPPPHAPRWKQTPLQVRWSYRREMTARLA